MVFLLVTVAMQCNWLNPNMLTNKQTDTPHSWKLLTDRRSPRGQPSWIGMTWEHGIPSVRPEILLSNNQPRWPPTGKKINWNKSGWLCICSGVCLFFSTERDPVWMYNPLRALTIYTHTETTLWHVLNTPHATVKQKPCRFQQWLQRDYIHLAVNCPQLTVLYIHLSLL